MLQIKALSALKGYDIRATFPAMTSSHKEQRKHGNDRRQLGYLSVVTGRQAKH
jgi:hypothetical protein